MSDKRAPKEYSRLNGPMHPSMKGSGSKGLHSSAGGGAPNVGQVRIKSDPAYKAGRRA